ncbi:unnamed protein product [Schistocephalus solidus]|uniref:Reverse transcriptase n=1 Tax=Schistocephalus solidus TaxID=70667 RepID=A0A183SKF4_SCHSO|nr:unnamed protein product [Schistocephalus solidus]
MVTCLPGGLMLRDKQVMGLEETGHRSAFLSSVGFIRRCGELKWAKNGCAETDLELEDKFADIHSCEDSAQLTNSLDFDDKYWQIAQELEWIRIRSKTTVRAGQLSDVEVGALADGSAYRSSHATA